MSWTKRISIKWFWVFVAIALAILLVATSGLEKFNTVVTYVEGFILGFVTYAIATKVYKL